MKAYLLKYNLPNIFKVGPVRFYPGVNTISEEDWNKIKENPYLKPRFDRGDLVWIKEPGDSFSTASADGNEQKPSDNPDKSAEAVEFGELEAVPSELIENEFSIDIKSLKLKEAVDLVNVCLKVTDLEAWLRKETRKGVIEAIESRIKLIDSYSEEKE